MHSVRASQKPLHVSAEILSAFPDAVILTDNEQRIRFWNSAAAERYGVPASEAYGKPLAEILEYRFETAEAESTAWAALETEGRWRGESTHIGPDGREWRVEATLTVVRGAEGEPEGLLAVLRDIAEAKRPQAIPEASKRRLQKIFENAAMGIAISDRNGGFGESNDAFCALIGYTREELGRMAFFDLVHPADREENLLMARRVLSGQIPSFEIENRYVHKSGRSVWVRKFVSIAEEEDGLPAKLMALVTDVTERRRAELDSRLLLRLDRVIAEAREPGELARSALQLLGEYLALDRCSFSEFDPAFDLASVAFQWRAEGPPELTTYQLRDFYRPELLAALKAGGSVGIADVEKDSRTAPFASRFAAQHFRALAQTPYLRDGKPVAILAAIVSKPRIWERADLALLREVVSRVWPAVERARVAGELRESEERLRLAAQAAGFGIRDYEVETGRCFWSEEMYEVLGLPPGSDSNPWKLIEVVHPADRKRVTERLERAFDPADSGEFDVEFRIVRPSDGSTRWVHNRSRTFYRGTGPGRTAVRNTGILIDITGRKQAEQALAAAVQRLNTHIDNSPLAIVHFNADFRITRWSKEAEALFGWSASEVIGRALDELRFVHEDDVETVRAFCRGYRDGSQPRAWSVNRNYRKDGSVIECEWHCSTIYDRDGHMVSVLCQVLDLTEKRLTEERLRQAQKTESVAVLAGGIAHDFNNLLTGVIGNVSLVREMLDARNPAQQLLEGVIQSAEEAARLTKQLLAYAGKGKFVVERLHVPGIVREIAELARATSPRGISTVVEIEPVPAFIRADRLQIHQVLLNLVTNATEAVDAAGDILIRSGVRALHESEITRLDVGEATPGAYAYIQVRDTGCGMDEQTRARMFDPFFSTKFQGRGLGLAAVAGIVRAQHGGLRVESAPGEGTSVTAFFPLDEPPDVHASPARAARPEPAPGSS